jgi:hypothetical protein
VVAILADFSIPRRLLQWQSLFDVREIEKNITENEALIEMFIKRDRITRESGPPNHSRCSQK